MLGVFLDVFFDSCNFFLYCYIKLINRIIVSKDSEYINIVISIIINWLVIMIIIIIIIKNFK